MAALLLSLAALPGSAQSLQGKATVVDGDTLELRGRRVRLFGVDAPESSQTCEDARGQTYRCGQRAALALDHQIKGQTVRCESRGQDGYGRSIAVCFAGKTNLNAWLVENGHAIAYRRYAKDYIAAEQRARAKRVGIWAGRFVEPFKYRRAHRKRSAPPPKPAALAHDVNRRCGGKPPIKGNINRRGKRIYHLPGSEFYARTRIDERQGEQYFCSEEAAKRAGFVKAGAPRRR